MENREHLDALLEIRSLMERSSRFISLSGLAGVGAGLSALLGSSLVYTYLQVLPFSAASSDYLVLADYERGPCSTIDCA